MTNTTECWKKQMEEKIWGLLKKEFEFIISPVLDKSIKETIQISLVKDTFLWMASGNRDLDPHYYKYQVEAIDKERNISYFVKIHEEAKNTPSVNLTKNLQQEINRQRMATFTSPYLAKLYHVEDDGRFSYFIYEKAEGKSLLELEDDEIYQKLDDSQKEKVIFKIFYEILYGIYGYASGREHPMVHRDLTPWNILYNLELKDEPEVHIKIIDFGQMHVDAPENGTSTEFMDAIPFSPQYARYDYTDYCRVENGYRQTKEISLDFYSATMIFIRLFEGKDYFDKDEARKSSIRKEEFMLTMLDRNRITRLCFPKYHRLLHLLDKITRSTCNMSIEGVVSEYTKFLLNYYKVDNLSKIFNQSQLLIPKKKIRDKKELLIRYQLCGGKSDGTTECLFLQNGNGVILDPANHDGCCFIIDSRYTKGLIHRAFYLYVWKDRLKCLTLHQKALVNGESKIGKIVTLKEEDELSLGVFSIIITKIIGERE